MKLEVLKTKMREAGVTYADAATALGITITTFNDKMNGKRKFYVIEANMLSDLLGLTVQERIDIFLPFDLHDVQETA